MAVNSGGCTCNYSDFGVNLTEGFVNNLECNENRVFNFCRLRPENVHSLVPSANKQIVPYQRGN